LPSRGCGSPNPGLRLLTRLLTRRAGKALNLCIRNIAPKIMTWGQYGEAAMESVRAKAAGRKFAYQPVGAAAATAAVIAGAAAAAAAVIAGAAAAAAAVIAGAAAAAPAATRPVAAAAPAAAAAASAAAATPCASAAAPGGG
jgi:hypothetical protein